MSQFSNEQLESLAKGDYSKLSDDQLQQLSTYHDEQTKQAEANKPTPVNQPGPIQSAIAPVFGAGAAAAGMAAAVPGAAFELAKEHPLAAGALGYAFKKPIEEGINKMIRDPAMRAAQSVKDLALKGLQGGSKAVTEGATRLGSIAPEALNISSMARAAAPFLRGSAGLGLMTHSGGLNTGEAAELERLRAKPGQQPFSQPYSGPAVPGGPGMPNQGM